MKDSLNARSMWRKRLVVVFVLSVVAVVAFAATFPGVITGPVGGALAGY